MAISDTMSQQIINQAWSKAEALSELLQARLDAAETAVSGSTSMGTAAADPITSISKPNVLIPEEATGPDIITFLDYNEQIIDKLVVLFANYITTYFPSNAASLSATETWLQNSIDNGGTGINAAVEAQIWERDRSRILDEANRADEEVKALWATRGFPLPPGALTYQTAMIQQKAQDAISAASRDTAIKVFQTEVEGIRFAVESAIKLRQVAVSSAGDYIKAMAGSQQIAQALVTSQSELQARLITAAASFYNADIQAAEAMFRSRATNAGFAQESGKVNATIGAQDRHKRGDVAVAAADAVARQAAAMNNNLHTSVGVQGTERL